MLAISENKNALTLLVSGKHVDFGYIKPYSIRVSYLIPNFTISEFIMFIDREVNTDKSSSKLTKVNKIYSKWTLILFIVYENI